MARPFAKQDPTLPQGYSLTFRTRFWSKVNKDGPVPCHVHHLGPCWIWTGAPGSDGYGYIGLGGRMAGDQPAHRASWVIHYGPIPDGQFVLHACDTHLCIRPDHLFLGTQADNIADMISKGRMVVGDHSGERNGLAVISWDIARLIRSMRSGGATRKEIIAKTKASVHIVKSVLGNRTWVEP